MLRSSLLSIYTLICTFTFVSCSPASASARYDGLVARDNPPRDVYLIIDTAPETMVTLPDGRTVFYMHTATYIAGNDQDGPLKLEYAIDEKITAGDDRGFYFRVYDMGTAASNRVLQASGDRTITKVGTVNLRNTDIYDYDEDTGLAIDTIDDDPLYRVGSDYKGNINGCNVYAKKLVEKMGLTYPAELQAKFQGALAWQETRPSFEVKPRTVAYFDRGGPNGAMRMQAYLRMQFCFPGRKTKRAQACGPKNPILDTTDIPNSETDLAADTDYEKLPSEQLGIDNSGGVSDVPAKDGAIVPPDTDAQTTMTRVANVLKPFMAVSKAALATLGAAGVVVGALFVILDFIDHNWVGGAIGAIGLAAGVAIGFASSGPIGWIVGGIVAALFAILPGLFTQQKPPPAITDIQGIIQWKMFGDASHTGNEQCQAGTQDVPGNKDCQALYGSGTLATVLGMNNFDSIAYLIQNNQGYPMTIKDMVPTWYVIDPKKPNDGADKIATINCNNDASCQPPDRPPLHPGLNPNKKRDCVPKDDPGFCKNPTFSINRNLITLPHIGQTADKAFGRLIGPNNNGDCKLVAYPGESKFADFGITVTGLPSAIACGLTAAINVDGTAIPLDAPSIGNPNVQPGSTANQSTNGQGGAYVAPPPPTPFASLTSDKYPCVTYTGQSICFPPGKFGKQSGLGYEQGLTTALTVPSGWSFETYWIDVEVNRPPAGGGRPLNPNRKRDTTKFDHTYTSNQDTSNDQFAQDMKGIDKNQNNAAYMVAKAPDGGDGPDPVCCFYNAPSQGGDVLCLGVGGGDLPDQWKKQAKSVECLAGGQMWIYAEKYGDAGGILINGKVDDLVNEPYGTSASFTLNVVAAWVSKQQ